jgi:uncharacterized protein (DUF2236 family)
MPPREAAAGLIPPRDGITWRVAGDVRLFASSGYALLLQVMHPSVGAGVAQHSNFKADPWGRLVRTLDYTSSVIYGGPELAWEMGRRVREMHEQIRGVRPDGRSYRALDPGPYAWVHATLAVGIVQGHQRFCGALTPEETEELWSEWRRMGRLSGVGDDDLPETWSDAIVYFDGVVDHELEETEAARDVLAALRGPAAPPLPWLPASAWHLLRWPPGRAAWLATVGMLPPVLRDRLQIDWRADRELRFRLLARASRASRPLLPPQARRFGAHYLRWRGIERAPRAA